MTPSEITQLVKQLAMEVQAMRRDITIVHGNVRELTESVAALATAHTSHADVLDHYANHEHEHQESTPTVPVIGASRISDPSSEMVTERQSAPSFLRISTRSEQAIPPDAASELRQALS